jgi:hypothetical protein
MGLNKGITNNLNGRPVGSKNKATAEIRELLTTFIAENWENVQQDFNALDPKERLAFYEKILQYTLPKLQSQTIETVSKSEEPLISYDEFIRKLSQPYSPDR